MSDRFHPAWLGLAAAVMAVGGLALVVRETGETASRSAAERAFQELSRSEIIVNTDFELEDLEPLPDGFSGRVGRIEASYDGPDAFDVVQIAVFESEGNAEERWENLLDDAAAIQVPPSTRQPRFASQICALKNQTVKCSVRMYEAVVTGMAGETGGKFLEENVTSNAQTLLMAGVKNWLDARGLELPEDQEV